VSRKGLYNRRCRSLTVAVLWRTRNRDFKRAEWSRYFGDQKSHAIRNTGGAGHSYLNSLGKSGLADFLARISEKINASDSRQTIATKAKLIGYSSLPLYDGHAVPSIPI
jgi:hypothetical protein